MAYEFLRKYGKDGDEEDSGFSSKVPLGLNKNSVDNKREGKQQGMDLGISSGVCYKFQRSGKCTRRDCRYKHIYPKNRIPTPASKTVLMELKDTKAERMRCATNLKEQGHVPEVTVSIFTVVIALERKYLSQTTGRCLTKQLVTLGQHQTEERELDKED